MIPLKLKAQNLIIFLLFHFSLDPNPLVRHTFWSVAFGGFGFWLKVNACNQTMVQRYLALPTLTKARW